MSRDPDALEDIVEAATLVASYVNGKSPPVFFADRMCQDAVIRRLEIIGEAARRISAEFKASHSHIPWSHMARFRDRMIHHYDDIDMVIVWDTATLDLPPLLAAIKALTGRP